MFSPENKSILENHISLQRMHLHLKSSFSQQTFSIAVKFGFIQGFSEDYPGSGSVQTRRRSAPPNVGNSACTQQHVLTNVRAPGTSNEIFPITSTEPTTVCNGASAIATSSSSSADGMTNEQQRKWLLHESGNCRPCNYQAFKTDGCRKGAACEFCHFDTRKGIRAKKRKS